MEAVRKAGLSKVAIFCLAGLPAGISSVVNRIKTAKRVITVDGCANNCAKKLADAAGIPVSRAITLASDLGVKKVAFHQQLADGVEDPMECVSDADVQKAVAAILEALE